MRSSYKANVVGSRCGIYSDACTCYAYINPLDTTNYKEVNFDGVNGITVYRKDDGEMTIVQAGGWSQGRGIFCDMYSSRTGKLEYSV